MNRTSNKISHVRRCDAWVGPIKPPEKPGSNILSMTLLRCVLMLCWFAFTAAPGFAAEIPDKDDVRSRFSVEMPGHWQLTDFVIEATSNYGTEVEPVFKQRFVATVSLRTDTFELDRKKGPITWIIPIAKVGEQRVIYGLATSIRKAGTWQTDFTLESNPMEGVGQPRSAFPGRVIVSGTAEEEAFLKEEAESREALEAVKHQEKLARLRREEELKEAERQAERTRLESEAKTSELQRQALAKKRAAEQALDEAFLKGLAERAANQLAIQLPGYWTVKEFTADRADKKLVDGKSHIEQKFTALIELSKDTYQQTEKHGTVAFLTPVAKAEQQRRLFGTIEALETTGTPEVTLKFENPAAQVVGQPVDFFSGRSIIVGSQEEKTFRQQKHERELEDRRRQEELREQDRQAELAKLTHEARLEDEKRKAEAARLAAEARLRDEAEQRQAREREAAAKRKAEAEQQQARDRETAVKAREQELAALRAVLFGNDPAARQAALDAALSSGDTARQTLALKSKYHNTRKISGEFLVKKGKEDISHPFIIDIDNIDIETGQLSGKMQGALDCSGTIHGGRLSVSGRSNRGPGSFSFGVDIKENGQASGPATGQLQLGLSFIQPFAVRLY